MPQHLRRSKFWCLLHVCASKYAENRKKSTYETQMLYLMWSVTPTCNDDGSLPEGRFTEMSEVVSCYQPHRQSRSLQSGL